MGEGALKLVRKGYSVFIFDRIDIIYKKTFKKRTFTLKKGREKKGSGLASLWLQKTRFFLELENVQLGVLLLLVQFSSVEKNKSETKGGGESSPNF